MYASLQTKKGWVDNMAAVTWDEKIRKAQEDAVKKAEEDGLGENETNALIAEYVSKVEKAKKNAEEKAVKAAGKSEKSYRVKVTANPEFCGIGAGGVQFAHGEALIRSKRMAEWFREHDGYTVTDQE